MKSSETKTPTKRALKPAVEEPKPEPKAFWRPLPTVLLVFFVYLVSQFVAGLAISIYPALRGWNNVQVENWLETAMGQFWVVLLIEAAVVWLVWLLLRVKRTNFKAIGLRWPRGIDIAYALSGFVVYFLLYLLISMVAKVVFPSLDFEQEQQIGFETARETGELILVFVSLVILPPIVEEILTRGFLYTGLKTRLPIWAAATITSVMFALAHLQFGSGAPLLWVAAIDTFALSFVLIYLREATGGLGAPILLHMLKNGIAFTLLFIVGVN